MSTAIRTAAQWCAVLLLTCSLALLAEASAWAGSPAEPLLTPIPPLSTALLVDPAGMLEDSQAIPLVVRLRSFQQEQRGQVAILLVPELRGETLAQYALRVAEHWRLGRAGQDDGVLILVVPSLPAARIEVGYGLEGVIPDALAARWLDELLPAIHEGRTAEGLLRLLDRIDSELRPGVRKFDVDAAITAHPEWIVAVVLTALSPFTLIPLFFYRRWGWCVSGVLIAACLGGAAFALWGVGAGGALAGSLLTMPYFWRLTGHDVSSLATWQRIGRALANALAVLQLFAIASLLIRAGLIAAQGPLPLWTASIFGGLVAAVLAGLLFPRLGGFLVHGVGGAMFFLSFLAVAYPALAFFRLDPLLPALAVAGAGTGGVLLMLYLDRRGDKNLALWLCALLVLLALPLALLALWVAATGDDAQQRLLNAAAGGGALVGVGWLAVRVGLGGLFGGGGAGR